VLLQVLVDAKSFDAAVRDFDAALALAPVGKAVAGQGTATFAAGTMQQAHVSSCDVLCTARRIGQQDSSPAAGRLRALSRCGHQTFCDIGRLNAQYPPCNDPCILHQSMYDTATIVRPADEPITEARLRAGRALAYEIRSRKAQLKAGHLMPTFINRACRPTSCYYFVSLALQMNPSLRHGCEQGGHLHTKAAPNGGKHSQIMMQRCSLQQQAGSHLIRTSSTHVATASTRWASGQAREKIT
jgi:hypothetical protein